MVYITISGGIIIHSLDAKLKNRVKELRIAAGFNTQKELSDLTGFSVDLITRIESNSPRATRNIGVYLRIANVLGVKIDDLFFKD
jgi:transcriptional regulator with XRE-family HTH domain